MLTASNIGRFRAVLDALDLVSYLILGVVMSMVSNTITRTCASGRENTA